MLFAGIVCRFKMSGSRAEKILNGLKPRQAHRWNVNRELIRRDASIPNARSAVRRRQPHDRDSRRLNQLNRFEIMLEKAVAPPSHQTTDLNHRSFRAKYG